MAFPLLLLLAVAQATPPPEPLAGMIRGAIWEELRSNGMIGNGNEVASLWMNFWGSGDNPPQLRILDLRCRGNGHKQRCSFDLLRDGGPIMVDGKHVRDRIRCSAPFKRSDDADGGWNIPRLSPDPRGGHTRTTMRCSWAPSG